LLFPLVASANLNYGAGYYTNLCGSGTAANFYSCSANCNPATGECSGNYVVKWTCDGNVTDCRDNESAWSSYHKVDSPHPGCNKTVQIDVFSKNCREGGGWNCGDSDLLGYMVWYSGSCAPSQEQIVGRVVKDGVYQTGLNITSHDSKSAGWGLNEGDYYYHIGRWSAGAAITINLNNPYSNYSCRWSFDSKPHQIGGEASGNGCSAAITIGSGSYSPDWQNHLWFYLEEQGAPTVDIKANGSNGPITLYYRDYLTLSWESENAASCQATGDWAGAKSVDGSEVIQLNLVKTYNFTLICQNQDGSQTANDSVAVIVRPRPPTVITKPAVITL